jgi:F-type H+-transporting ATPase subunit epsilon
MSKPGSLSLFILSPERKLLEGEHVQKVSVFTTEGEVEVFPGHEDYLCQLSTGKFSYQTVAGKTVRGVISTGFIRIEDQKVVVLAETLELEGEIDQVRAKRAQDNAQKMLKEASLDPDAFKKYNLKLQRAIVRQTLH